MLRLLMLGAAVANGGQPARKPKPMNGGPITALAVLLVVGVVAVIGWQHHLTVTLLVVTPLIVSAIILVGTVIKSMAAAKPLDRVDPDAIPRMKQVQALLSAPCPICHAQPGATCEKVPGKPVALIDSKWNTLCHFGRMEKAVQYRMVTRADLIAQWDGHVPEGLKL